MAYMRKKINQDVVDDLGVVDTGFTPIPTASDDINQRITWGEPAKALALKESKTCPSCNLTRKDGFQILIEEGNLIGAWCPCGFSF